MIALTAAVFVESGFGFTSMKTLLIALILLAFNSVRTLQSGHVGDYVTWMTVGIAVMSAAFIFLLR